ncbi:MAG TPA: cellulase family glycosylhydrolase, partial [Dehalococcoidia bacterium]
PAASQPGGAAAPASAQSTRYLQAGGRTGFIVGANYPWLTYGTDFGAGPRRPIGVHYGGVFDGDFASMKAHGVEVVRWFVFADARYGIDFAPDGTPTGLQPEVLQDLDAAVALARAHDLYLMPVLFDYLLLGKPRATRGTFGGGHSDVMTDPRKRRALLDNVVAPVIQHFAGEPRILAWDLMNEPEWAISDLPSPSVEKEITPMTQADFWDFASKASALIHAGGGKVTIGSASLKWVNLWTDESAVARGLPAPHLDFYQVHYYGWMDGKCSRGEDFIGNVCWSPLEQDAGSLALDKPVIVGEMEGGPTVEADLDRLLANGYAGALLWSYHASISTNWDGLRDWAAHHGDATAERPR